MLKPNITVLLMLYQSQRSSILLFLNPFLVYCNNVSAIYLSGNLVQQQCTKHIEIDIHFVQEKVACGQAHVLHVNSGHQIADIFTKWFPCILFDDFRTSLSAYESSVSTVGV